MLSLLHILVSKTCGMNYKKFCVLARFFFIRSSMFIPLYTTYNKEFSLPSLNMFFFIFILHRYIYCNPIITLPKGAPIEKPGIN